MIRMSPIRYCGPGVALIATAAPTSASSLHNTLSLAVAVTLKIAPISECSPNRNFCDLVRQIFLVGTVRIRLEHATSQLRRNLVLSIRWNVVIRIKFHAGHMYSDLSRRWLHLPDFLSECRIRQAFLKSFRQLSERTWKASQKQSSDGKQAAWQHATNIGPCFPVFKKAYSWGSAEIVGIGNAVGIEKKTSTETPPSPASGTHGLCFDHAGKRTRC